MAMKYTTFPTTVGIEYSFVPTVVGNEYLRCMTSSLAAVGLKSCPYLPVKTRARLHSEYYAVEVPSPVHRNEEALTRFANRLFSQVNNYYLTPRLVKTNSAGVETYVGTGGGHVHLGIPRGMGREKRNLFLRNVAIDCANRPEMNWFFQEWLDNDTLPHKMMAELRHQKVPLSPEPVADYPVLFRNTPIAIRTAKGRQFGKAAWNTLEFRMFDAPRSPEMAKRNVDFALSYFEYVKGLTDRGVKVKLRKRNILERESLTAEQVKARLQRLFRKIGLRYADYHETYWPNYEMRAAHGKL